MGQLNCAESTTSPSSVGGRKRVTMEAMTNEELRLNKQLLQEVANRKKERMERLSIMAPSVQDA